MTPKTPLRLGDTTIDVGERRFFYLPASETVAGPFHLPITAIVGVAPGPTIAITAACHPGEYNGLMASIRLARRIEPAALRGNVIVAHIQNVAGVQAKVGHSSPVDGVNMGRAFPVPGETVEIHGNVSHQTTSPTYQIAERIFEEILLPSDAHVDLHGGEFFEYVPPNIEYLLTGRDDVDERTRELARAFGFRLLWEVPPGSIPEMPGYPGRGSAVFEAAMQGIPSVLCEVGGDGRLDESLIELTVNGVIRVLAYYEMIDEAPPPADETQVTLVGGHVLFAQRAGMFLSVVEGGDEIRKGQLLGRIIDLTGTEVERIHSPADAVLTNVVSRGIANPGDMLFVMGNMPGTGSEKTV
jgi:predicted deacylase